MNKESVDFKRLGAPENKRRMNALLNLYDAYRDIFVRYAEDPAHLSDEFNLFYMTELVPAIEGLVDKLGISRRHKSDIKIPEGFIPFKSLFGAEKTLKDAGKTLDDARIEMFTAYEWIKYLARDLDAVGQEPLPEIEEVRTRAMEFLYVRERENSDDDTESEAVEPLRITSPDGKWWYATHSKRKRPVKLFQKGTLRGELLGILGEPWGKARTQDHVLEALRERTGEEPTGKQIDDAMKDINREFGEHDLPPLRLKQDRDTWTLLYK